MVRALLLVFLSSTAFAQSTLYVAPGGSDRGPGTQAAPFATIARARDEIRRLKSRTTVYLRAGTYEIGETLHFGAQDSGSVYRAFEKEKVILSGAHRVGGFVPYQGKILKTHVDGSFHQLFYKGERQHLARYPNYDAANPYAGGWAYVDGKPVPMYQEVPGEDKHTLRFQPDDARAFAAGGEGAEIMVFPRYNWWNNIVQVKSVDVDSHTATLAGDCSYAIRPGDRYYVQNVLSELDAPGEWYLDRKTGTLYFWPPDGDASPVVDVPRVRTILQLDPGASNVTFRGLAFENFEGTGIVLSGTTHCLIAGNVIRNGGDYGGAGVAVNGGTENGVVGNDISQIGAHGVALSGGDRASLTPSSNFADNNYIHHVGVFYKQGVGISMTGVGIRASHNLIHDVPRMAIMFSGNNLILEYNHMRHVNLETEDTGVVYTGGRDWISSRGTAIRYNYMHDSIGFGQENGKWKSPHFSWGVYLDDNTGGVDVIGNIVVRAYRGLIHLHNGRDNLIENNVFAGGKLQQAEFNGWTADSHYWKDHFPTMVKGYDMVKDQPAWKGMRNIGTSPEQAVLPGGLIMSGNVFRRNIVYFDEPSAKLFGSRNLPLDHNQWDENLYWHVGGGPLKIALGGKLGELDLEGWQARGEDVHSMVADPKFVDAAAGDYRLRSDSPALKMGFRQIPVEKIGLYKDEMRASWPVVEAAGERERVK